MAVLAGSAFIRAVHADVDAGLRCARQAPAAHWWGGKGLQQDVLRCAMAGSVWVRLSKCFVTQCPQVRKAGSAWVQLCRCSVTLKVAQVRLAKQCLGI